MKIRLICNFTNNAIIPGHNLLSDLKGEMITHKLIFLYYIRMMKQAFSEISRFVDHSKYVKIKFEAYKTTIFILNRISNIPSIF